MVNMQVIRDIIINIKLKYPKNKSKRNLELKLLSNYISKSNMFIGKKKKLYSEIIKAKL